MAWSSPSSRMLSRSMRVNEAIRWIRSVGSACMPVSVAFIRYLSRRVSRRSCSASLPASRP
ncbi:Uncharacterised protein [Bordetella pertussis]|nr:Uncharacterised protein [Bordetella pertussis]